MVGTWGLELAGAHLSVPVLGGAARLSSRQDLHFGLMSASGADSAVAVGFAGGAGQGWLGVGMQHEGWRPLPSAPPPVSSLDLPGPWAESTGPAKLNSLHAQHRPSPTTVLRAPDPVPSVLRVSTLGRSPLGPRPRSSLWSSTPAPQTSGCPLSTARAMPAVSDLPSQSAPPQSEPRPLCQQWLRWPGGRGRLVRLQESFL